MLRRIWFKQWMLLAVSFAWSSWSVPGGASAAVQPRVLLLNSYHYGLSWTDRLTASVFEELSSADADITVEYLDTKRRPLADSEDFLLPYLVERHAGERYDVVMISDNDALDFIRRHRERLIPETPVVFCGINYFKRDMLDDSGMFTGVMEVTDPGGTFDLIRTLRPGVRRVVVIADGTPTGMAEARAARSALGDQKDGVKIDYLENRSIGEILHAVAALDPLRDAVLLTVLNFDADGRYFPYEESARLITDAAPCPVFGLWDFYLGTGVVGGRMASATDQGRAGAELAKALLAGRHPRELPIVEDSPNRDMFDAPALLKHSFAPRDLPPQVSVLNETSEWVALGRGGFASDTQLPYQMFEGHGAIMMLINPADGQILDANEAAVRFYGYPREVLLGMSMMEINLLSRDEVALKMREAQREEVNRFRFQHKLADGEIRHVDVAAWPVEVRGAQVLFSIVQDITEAVQAGAEIERLLADRTQALGRRTRALLWTLLAFLAAQTGGVVLLVRALRKQKILTNKIRADGERLRTLSSAVEQSPAAVVITNLEGNIQYVNSRFTAMTGYAANEVLGKNPRLLKAGEQSPESYREMWAAIAKGDAWHGEFRNKKKNGELFWVSASVSPVKDETGRIDRYLGIMEDISKRKLAEEAILEINLELEEANARANSMAADAQMASIAKSEFLANMSHEIRTPMNGVIGMTGLLLETELTDDQRRYAGIVKSSGESLLALLNDILDFSKIEAGKLDLETMDFDLQSLLDDFAATMAMRAHEKGLELICAADLDVPTMLSGDPGRLRQILANLVGNAIKFTEKGEVVVRIENEKCKMINGGEESISNIEHGMSKNEKERIKDKGLNIKGDEEQRTTNEEHATGNETLLRFSVVDTGIGIPAGKVGLLFDKFSQVDASTTRRFGGTGLGLAISKQLAELMGGEVGVNSVEGEGSEFWFTARFGVRADAAREPPPAPENLSGVRVLVVDDNATNREVLVPRLRSWGMRPEEASDGPSALQALCHAVAEGAPFRLAVIDMQMPGMNGESLGRVVKTDEKLADTRLVMFTSLGTRGDARRLQEIGFSGYAAKPIQYEELKGVLSLALAGGEQQPIATRHTVHESLPRFEHGKFRILLAEDNTTNQQVALSILKKLGLKADVVANGCEALEALKTIPYDLVLMDCQMPVMDGYEATRRIRANEEMINDKCKMINGRKDSSKPSEGGTTNEEPSGFRSPPSSHSRLPVIAMTAHAMQGDREKCLEAGMDDYIAKPVEPGALAGVLKKWLKENEENAEREEPPEGGTTNEEPRTRNNIQSFKGGITENPQISGFTPQPSAMVWDRAGALKRMMGDEELVDVIIGGFLEDLPLRIEALRGCLEAGDAARAGSEAHTIKGAAGNVGANALRILALELEKSCQAGDLVCIRAHLNGLVAGFEAFRKEVESVRNMYLTIRSGP